jgi:alkylation response protein AidB-like acyl-CoA dehydrogenase
MKFGLSEEQIMLQDALRAYLSENAALARTRRFAAEKETRASDVIVGLAQLGVTGVIAPEAQGGAGLTLLDAALVCEQLGYHVTPAPFIGSCVIAPLALMRAGTQAQRGRWLAQIASGAAVAGVALTEATGARADGGVEARSGKLFGRALFVLDFAADVYVMCDKSSGLHLVAADAPGLTREALATIDVTRPTGDLVFDGAPAEPLVTGAGVMRGLIDAGRVMIAADALGAAQAMLDQAVAYAKTREQFGRPIGSFQAVKHMCAEMAAALEPCRALVWYAAHALDAGLDDASVAACHAKAHVCEVATFVARTATEVHGGTGFTDLVGLHYWFKRIGFDRQVLGAPQRARADAAKLQGYAAA